MKVSQRIVKEVSKLLSLREARNRRDLTQEQLGALAGVGLNGRVVSEIERGIRIATPEQKRAMAKILETDESDVLFCLACVKTDDGYKEYDDLEDEYFDDDEEDNGDDEEDDDDWN